MSKSIPKAVCTIEHQHSVDIPFNSRELKLECLLHVHIQPKTESALTDENKAALRRLAMLIAQRLEQSIHAGFEPTRLVEDMSVLIKDKHEEASSLQMAFTGHP